MGIYKRIKKHFKKIKDKIKDCVKLQEEKEIEKKPQRPTATVTVETIRIATPPPIISEPIQPVDKQEKISPQVVEEKKKISVFPNTPTFFSDVKATPNPHLHKPIGQLFKQADYLLVKFAKLKQNPDMPDAMVKEYPLIEKVVHDLQQSIHEEEQNRKPHTVDQDLLEKEIELEQISQDYRALLTRKKTEHDNKRHAVEKSIAEINRFKSELAVKESVETIHHMMKPYIAAYTAHMSVLKEEVYANKPAACSCHENQSYWKMRAELDDMELTYKKYQASDIKLCQSAVEKILNYHISQLNPELEHTIDLSAEEKKLALTEEQLQKIKNKLSQDAERYPYQLGKQTMLDAVRFDALTQRLLAKSKELPVDGKSAVCNHAIQILLSRRHTKFANAAEKFFCPSINDFDYPHFQHAFTALADDDQQAVIKGEAHDITISQFMPSLEPIAMRRSMTA